MIKKLIPILLLLAIPLCAQTTEITTKGLGAIINDDIASARDQAIDDALRRAVQQTLGTEIKSSTLVQNFQLAEDNILSWSRGYVSKYDIVKEGRALYDVYEVVVRAEIETDNLMSDEQYFAQLLEQMDNPRVLVLIDEQNIDPRGYEGYFSLEFNAAENTIIEELQDKGIEVIDPSMLKLAQEREEIIATLSGDTEAATAVAARVNAEIVITGKAVSRASRNFSLGDMISCQANISLRAVKVGNASIIATVNEHAAYPHIDEITGGIQAIEKAAKKAGESLIDKIFKKGEDEFYNFTTIKMVIKDAPEFSDLNKFATKLRYSIRGIKKLRQRDVVMNTAEYDVVLTGNAHQLARELAAKDFSPYKVEILGVTQTTVNLRLQK